MALSYDGTLPGFLTALGQHHDALMAGQSLVRSDHESSNDLFHGHAQVTTDHAFSTRVAERLTQRLGQPALSTLGWAFMSEDPDVEAAMMAFIRAGFIHGPKVLQRQADPPIHRVLTLARRTRRERHRLLGLLRFVRLEGDLYLGRVAPRHHVVPLLADHFARRLADQQWLIIDTQRRVGIYGQQGQWELVDDYQLPNPLPLHPEEAGMAELWCGFYRSIAIPERFNPKLRQQFMPKHSWRYLTEMMNEGA